MIIMNIVRAMPRDSGLDDRWWAEAVLCAAYLSNHMTHKILGEVTPNELWYGRKPSVAHLKRFGCVAYVHMPKQNRRKLDARAKLGIIVGYAIQTRGYRIWLLHS